MQVSWLKYDFPYTCLLFSPRAQLPTIFFSARADRSTEVFRSLVFLVDLLSLHILLRRQADGYNLFT